MNSELNCGFRRMGDRMVLAENDAREEWKSMVVNKLGTLVCSSFLIRMCMFIVSKA